MESTSPSRKGTRSLLHPFLSLRSSTAFITLFILLSPFTFRKMSHSLTHTTLQILLWRVPSLVKEFSPYVLYGKYGGHYDDVVSLGWSADSRHIISGSMDRTARIHSIEGKSAKAVSLSLSPFLLSLSLSLSPFLLSLSLSLSLSLVLFLSPLLTYGTAIG